MLWAVFMRYHGKDLFAWNQRHRVTLATAASEFGEMNWKVKTVYICSLQHRNVWQTIAFTCLMLYHKCSTGSLSADLYLYRNLKWVWPKPLFNKLTLGTTFLKKSGKTVNVEMLHLSSGFDSTSTSAPSLGSKSACLYSHFDQGCCSSLSPVEPK